MSIKFVNTPSLEGMDAQITPVVGENPLCRIPSVRALYTAVSRQELMDHKPPALSRALSWPLRRGSRILSLPTSTAAMTISSW